MKIVYCIPTISTTGGVERVIATKADWLANHDYQVHIVCLEPQSTSFFKYDDKVSIHYLNSASWAYNPLNPKRIPEPKRTIRNVLVARCRRWWDQNTLQKIFMRISPDIIICALEDFEILRAMCTFKKKNPQISLILEAHGYRYANYVVSGLSIPQGEESISPPFLSRLLSRIGISIKSQTKEEYYRAMDMLVTLTDEDALNYGCEHVTSIPNPMTISYNYLDKNRIPKSNTVLAVGRYCIEKNFEDLVHIWKTISIDYPDWRLRIVGPGVPEGLKGVVNHSDNIDLVHKKQDLIPEYEQAEIFALTSKTEGFGLVLVEAQAFGIPTVSYNCPCGPSSIITDGEDGYLVEVSNQVEFAKRLRTLMSNYSLRKNMGIKAQKASQRYSLDNVMSHWDRLFKSLTS